MKVIFTGNIYFRFQQPCQNMFQINSETKFPKVALHTMNIRTISKKKIKIFPKIKMPLDKSKQFIPKSHKNPQGSRAIHQIQQSKYLILEYFQKETQNFIIWKFALPF